MLHYLTTRGRILLLMTSAALPMIALSVFVALEQRSTLEKRAHEELGQRAELLAGLLGGFRVEALPRGGASALGRGQMVTILDPNGIVITQYPPLFAAPGDRFPNARVLEGVRRGEAAFDEPDPAGVRRLYSVRTVRPAQPGGAELVVVISMPKALVHADIDRALAYSLGGFTLVTILLFVLAWHGAERMVLAPIRLMLETTRRVRAGDLAARTGMRPTREELSQLGAALDEMAAQLQTREAALEQALSNFTQQAMTDPLTGLYNRRFFWDALIREIAAARRVDEPFSVILLDIDHFKRVNDTWGHEAGDRVLLEIASLLESAVRGSDVAVRYGGEEFALLLPDTGVRVATERAERLRRRLERCEIPWRHERIVVTASFGVAQYSAATAEPAALMRSVDAALYRAKSAGRNKVVVHEPPGLPQSPAAEDLAGEVPLSIEIAPTGARRHTDA